MEGNFTDKNKHTDHNKSEAGFRLISMPKENGFGRVGIDSVMSNNGTPNYTPAPNRAPINGDGLDNFGSESRFAGDQGGQPRKGLSAQGEKDSIELMGKSGENIAREM